MIPARRNTFRLGLVKRLGGDEVSTLKVDRRLGCAMRARWLVRLQDRGGLEGGECAVKQAVTPVHPQALLASLLCLRSLFSTTNQPSPHTQLQPRVILPRLSNPLKVAVPGGILCHRNSGFAFINASLYWCARLV